MTISRHTSTLIVDGARREPVDLALTLDEASVPFAVLDATMPAGDTVDDVDPRQPQRVQVTMRQDFGDGDTLAALSADYAGGTLADLSRGAADLLPGGSGFEFGDLAGWQPEFGGVVELSTEHAQSGTTSMKIVADVQTPFAVAAANGPQFDVSTGQNTLFDFWAYQEGPDGHVWVTAEVWLYDAADVLLHQEVGVDYFLAEVDTWERRRVELHVPDDSDIAYAVPVISVQAYTDSDRSVWIDSVNIYAARQSVASISADYGRPYNTFGMRPSTSARSNLWLRSRTIDHATGEVSIEAASGEALLADYTLSEMSPIVPPGSTVRDCVNFVLGRVLDSAVSTPDTGSEVVEADALPWEPGETAWSYLSSITGSAGLRLWCDEVGLWHLADPELTIEPGHVVLGPETMTVLADSIDRAANGWADSAVVTYEWDDDGTRQRRYDVAGPGTVAVSRTVNRPYPGRGFARAIARKARAMGRVMRVGAVADYDARPLQPATLSAPSTADQAGVVSAVQWQQPGDVMTVRTRDLMSITENSWLYTPVGIAWDDVPTGISWDDYKWGDF